MRRVLALLALLAGAHALAQDDAATRAAEEARARRQLEQVRAEIRTLTDAQRATQGQREDATRALREQELAIAAVARELAAIQTRRDEQQRELDTLNRRRAELTERSAASARRWPHCCARPMRWAATRSSSCCCSRTTSPASRACWPTTAISSARGSAGSTR